MSAVNSLGRGKHREASKRRTKAKRRTLEAEREAW